LNVGKGGNREKRKEPKERVGKSRKSSTDGGEEDTVNEISNGHVQARKGNLKRLFKGNTE